MKNQFPRVSRWPGLDRFYDGLFGFWEDVAHAARQKLRRWLHAATARAPRCPKRKPLFLTCETLETRFVMSGPDGAFAPLVDPLQAALVPINPASVGTVFLSQQDGSFLLQ